MVAPPAIDTSTPPSHVDPLVSLPAPVIRLLVLFAGPIRYARSILEILLWKSGRRIESWMLVIAWWAFCLGGTYAFRYLLPPLIFLPLLPISKLRLTRRKSPPKHDADNPTSHEHLLATLSDLHAIHALIPATVSTPFEAIYARFRLLGKKRLIRGLLILWATWLIIGQIVPYQALFAFLGTIVLLIPSPALAHTVYLLSRSLYTRRAAALLFLIVFGSPPDQAQPFSLRFSPSQWVKSKWTASRRPSLAFSFKPKADVKVEATAEPDTLDESDGKASDPIFFRFEVHENQRWWMGLDWTSALLPQERPSWCDYHLQPVSPPPSFALPAPTSIVLPAPTKADPNARVKRTATWQWVDDDWSIVRAGQGSSSTYIPPPTPSAIPEEENAATASLARSASGAFGTSPSGSFDEGAASLSTSAGARTQSIAEQAFTKGLERLKARTSSPITTNRTPTGSMPSPQRASGEFQRTRKGSQASEDGYIDQSGSGPVPLETIAAKDEATDAEGWVYGDNKWENMSARGGLGKYTRRRRWQRRAVLTETVIQLPSDGAEEDIKTARPSPAATTASSQSPLKSRPVVASQPVSAEPIKEEEEEPSRARSDTTTSSVAPEVVIPPGSTGSRDDVLRQRLKKAMGNAGA